MKQRPAFLFYGSDWLRDPGLRSCSLGARGLWIDLLAFMHEADPYGHLKVNGRDISPGTLSRMVGSAPKETVRYLEELEAAGVFSRTDTGTIYSRRMVRDHELRIKRGEFGHLSAGHPSVPRRKELPIDDAMDTIPPSTEQSMEGSPSLSLSSSLTEERREEGERVSLKRSRAPKRKTYTDWPEGFTFSDAHRSIAEGLGLNVHAEFVAFRDNAQAKALQYADWNAAFRTWLNRSVEFKQRRIG